MRILKLVGLAVTSCLSSLMVMSCAGNGNVQNVFAIRADQCGYAPNEAKRAYYLMQKEGTAFISACVDDSASVGPEGGAASPSEPNEAQAAGGKLLLGKSFEVHSIGEGAPVVVLSGELGDPVYWAESGDSVQVIDFSALTKPGKYQIIVDGKFVSHPFEIGDNLHYDALRKSVRAYYYNRASMPIDSQYGGKWARAAGHPDDVVYVHKSAASPNRPEGTVISSPGGWYDAGDYNKYIVNSAITTYTLMLASNTYAPVADTLSLNIPESAQPIPDLTSETLYNLRWMLTMQDPADGGVYHKLTTLNFEGFIMPSECQQKRYVVTKSTAAALDFAATMAYASRTLSSRSKELMELARQCDRAAEDAYGWAKKNPNVIFHNPDDVSTGEYGDADLNDEWFWAATEMWLTTGDDDYAEDALAHKGVFGLPSWGNVGTLAYYSMVDCGESLPGVNPVSELASQADAFLAIEKENPMGVGLDFFDWGCNSSVANAALLKAMAYKASADKPAAYLQSIRNDLHYIFGSNATDYSFVTGVGEKYPMHIHHRPSSADNIDEPVPGFLVGGPNTVVPTDCGPKPTRSKYPARAYADEQCSYSTNEVAINWNAPLVFALLAELSLN